MNVTLEKSSEVEGRLTVNVVPADYEEKVKKELKEIGRTRVFPGFRKGHVPFGMIKRHFGQRITSDIVNEEVYRAVIGYIRENKLNILGEPMPVEVKNIDFDKETEFTFQYDLGFGPDLDVTVDKKVVIPYYQIEVPQNMIDEQDTAFRRRFGKNVDKEAVEEDSIVKGEISELNADGSLKEDGIVNDKGILTPRYLKEQSELFVGKKVGDKVTFNPAKASGENASEVASMLNIEKEAAQAVKADFQFEIKSISGLEPAELGQELFDLAFGKDNVKSEEEYFEEIRKMVSRELQQNAEMLFRNDARDVLVEKFGKFELPEKFLKRWLVARDEKLKEDNIDEEYNKSLSGIKWQLIEDRIISKYEIKVEEADVRNYAKMVAANQFAQYGMVGLSDELISGYAEKMLKDKNYSSRFVDDITDDRVFRTVKDNAKINEKKVTLDEFREIVKKVNEKA
ncbi:MAG: trigger factor [Muribaculaceae bacterium]|nr:trigger factor [Muribaculaceae bacterium]